LGADFYRVNRGGLITYHGPGQLVAYPILRLEKRHSTRWYVDRLEAAIIDLLKEFDLKGETSPHTGVWIGIRDQKKNTKISKKIQGLPLFDILKNA